MYKLKNEEMNKLDKFQVAEVFNVLDNHCGRTGIGSNKTENEKKRKLIFDYYTNRFKSNIFDDFTMGSGAFQGGTSIDTK